jgi:Ca2+-binding EF-hand superfamily protein
MREAFCDALRDLTALLTFIFFAQDLETLYNLYDTDKSGAIDYREFASEIF